jgi:hypothetical protein
MWVSGCVEAVVVAGAVAVAGFVIGDTVAGAAATAGAAAGGAGDGGAAAETIRGSVARRIRRCSGEIGL